ncbi:MAG: hypothetical protein HY919_06220 [Elusimicrobia bacterium]|nr:hypothetical protein [Elusimicrobiota bacterium]
MECQKCGRKIKSRYIIKIASYSAHDGLDVNLLDLGKDIKKEIKKLVKIASKKSEKQLLEDIYTLDEFWLCKECRDGFIKQIRSSFRYGGKH